MEAAFALAIAAVGGALLSWLWGVATKDEAWGKKVATGVFCTLLGALAFFSGLASNRPLVEPRVVAFLSMLSDEELSDVCVAVSERIRFIAEDKNEADAASLRHDLSWDERTQISEQGRLAAGKAWARIRPDFFAVKDELRRRGYDHRVRDPRFGESIYEPPEWDYKENATGLGVLCRTMVSENLKP